MADAKAIGHPTGEGRPVAVGVPSPMPVLDRSVYTSRPAELVWSFLSDFTTTEQWDPPTQETRRVEGDERVDEIVRMLSGRRGSTVARQHAEELLGADRSRRGRR